ncbi:hypothetical protein BH20VER3_BH20VER3_09030 [soil metagenome]
MNQRALLGLAAIFGLCSATPAQERAKSDTLSTIRLTLERSMGAPGASDIGDSFRALNGVWSGPAPVSLGDERLFSFPRAFGWVQAAPADFLPAFAPQPLPLMTAAPTRARDASGLAQDLPQKFDYVGGEVGLFYGRSTGKFRREVEQAYLLGEIVEGNTQITVGAYYEHSKGRAPRAIGP